MKSKSRADLDFIVLVSRVAWAVRRNLILVIILPVAGMLIGLGTSLLVQKQYESRMLLSSDILLYPNLERIFGTLNELLEEKNYVELEKRLHLDSALVSSVSSIKTELLIESETPSDQIERVEYLSVKVRTRDNDVLNALQNALLSYLQDNPFVKARVQQKKNFYTNFIKEINREIESLEELKRNISSGKFFETARGNILFDPTTVNSKILDLSRSRIEFENKLKLVESIHVIEGFAAHKKPTTGRKLNSIILGFIGGLFLAAAVIAVKSLIASVRENESTLN